MLAVSFWPATTRAFTYANFCCGDADFYDGGSALLEQRNACNIGTSGNVSDAYAFGISF